MDLNREICSIVYNCLNLPQRIDYQDGSYVFYTYNAGGEKLRTDYYINPLPNMVPQLNGGTGMNRNVNLQHTRVDYCGNLVYENDTLKQVLFEGGYVTFNGTTPQYHFYVQDHLGNNRVVCNASGTIEQVNHYYPYGGLFGESTNDEVQRYKYNGKELDRMHGLNLYDYHARQYDGAGVRFTSMDPLAEKYYHISPYAYCLNNPIRLTDPTGMEPDSLEAALMAGYSYDSNKDYKKQLATFGWMVEDNNIQSPSGFKATLFSKTKNENGMSSTEYTLAYAGTDFHYRSLKEVAEAAKDIVADIQNYLGIGISAQQVEAIMQAIDLSSEHNDLTFVGHSLGGGLAALSSMLTGKPAITFNPASVNGVLKIVGNLMHGDNNITQYRTVGKPVGGIFRVGGDPVNNFQQNTLHSSQGVVHPVYTNSYIPNHGINTFIKLFGGK